MAEQGIRERIREIAGDRSHGASELARLCLQIGADSALNHPAQDTGALLGALLAQAAEMASSRPSMAPVHNLLARWRAELDAMHGMALEAARQQAANAARAIAAASLEAVRQAAQHAQALVTQGQTIITHSLSSTLLEVFAGLQDRHVQVIVSESRPLCEGYSLARRLPVWDLDTSLITDAQIGLFAAEADLALVGADSLLADGSVVNKAGTYLLALAARDRSIPFYVCCESFKRRKTDMAAFRLEEMSPAELGAPELPNVTLRNVYFDVTPPSLVTGWISERGLVQTPED